MSGYWPFAKKPQKFQREALQRVLSKFNAIVLGHSDATLSFEYLPDRDTKAATIDKKIVINATHIDDLENRKKSRRDIIADIMALDLHELSHVLYSPRSNSRVAQKIISKGDKFKLVYNALEDQRIETYLSQRFSSVHRYLSQMVMEHVIKDNDANTAFIATYGRKYLPKGVRKHLENKSDIHDDYKEQIKQIIDDYRLLYFPDKDNANVLDETDERALELMQQLYELLYPEEKEEGQEQEEDEEDQCECESCREARDEEALKEQCGGVGASGELKANDEEQEKLSDKIRDADKKDADEDDGETPDTSPRDYLNNLKKDERHRKDIESLQDEIIEAGRNPGTKKTASFNGDRQEPVPEKMREQSRHLYAELSKVVDKKQAQWVYGEDEGRLNIQRYIQSEYGDEDLWDKWDEGQEQDTHCDIVIAVDSSGSMISDDRFITASQSLWAIKNACDRIDGVSTLVYAWGDENYVRVVYGYGDRVSNAEYKQFFESYGETCPELVMQLSSDILRKSTKRRKLFVMITDGVWDENDMSHHLQRMGDATTVLITIGYEDEGYPDSYRPLGFDLSTDTDSEATGLYDIIRDAVKHVMSDAK